MPSSILNRLRSLVKWAKVSRDATEDLDLSKVQVTYMGKVGEAVVLFPFGFHARVPADRLALVLNTQANQEARVALPSSGEDRPRDLAVGEVVLYHPETGAKIHLQNGGAVLVDSGGNRVTVPASGPMVLDGDVTVTGDLVVSGSSATLPATVTAGGTNIGATHTHVGSPTAPTGAISNTGTPV